MSLKALRFLPLILFSAAAWADTVHIPQALEDWRDWVLHDKAWRDCPFVFNSSAASRDDFVCAWPGRLELDVRDDSGRFSQTWTVYAEESWVPLPGDAAYWPDRVSANNRPIEIVARGRTPMVRLGPGTYQLSGRFEWDERPRELRVPMQVGLIGLVVDGRRVERPERARGTLFLGETETTAREVDAVRAETYRLLRDDIPLRLETRIRLEVSGKVREEIFAPALPEGFVPLWLNGALPARLEPDGSLHVQVRPGTWEISLGARAGDNADGVSMPTPASNMPAVEIWSYRSNPELRVTAAAGAEPVDPGVTQVPAEWQSLPAFRLVPGQSLTINERSRGMVATDNRLTLDRRLWLDFDGDGFVATDAISGTMRTGWRLDMRAPFELLSAEEGGERLLVTQGVDESDTGVELRNTTVALESLAINESRGRMPVTGWDSRFERVSATLYLPPGQMLLATPGVDRAPGSWLSSWELLDLFLLLIITIASGRLFGRTAGVITLLAVGLSFHQPGAPIWSWLNLLAGIALLRVAPAGRLRAIVRSYVAAGALVLVVLLVPFLTSELRLALYPQLEPQRPSGRSELAAPQVAMEPASVALDEARQLAAERVQPDAVQEIMVTGQAPRKLERYAPDTVLQAGAGVPDWEWNPHTLRWAGPVDSEQSMRLVILPRWLVTLLRFLEVGLLAAFVAILAAEILKRRWRLPGGLAIGRETVTPVLVAGLFACLVSAPGISQAQTPDPEILRELEVRLTAAPDCVNRCAEIAEAFVDVSADTVSMRLTIHAAEDVAVVLPGTAAGWRPQAVRAAGADAAVTGGPEGQLWLRVPAGQRTVELSGATGDADSLQIVFPLPPRVIRVNATDWQVGGIRDRRLISGALALTRQRSSGGADEASEEVRWERSRFPAFARIERHVEFGLDWEMTTIVNRVAPRNGLLAVEVPLVEGEVVVSEGVTVEDGKALVSIPPGARDIAWRSRLARVDRLEFAAQNGVPWSETWSFEASNTWRVEYEGVPESDPDHRRSFRHMPVFYPRGGESLTLSVSRPDAIPGETLAFDAVLVDVDQGLRLQTVDLSLDYRSTRGAQHVLRLPVDAEVTEVRIDGKVEPLRAEAGELTLPIVPGEHKLRVRWQQSTSAGLATRTPDIDLGSPASNIQLRLSLPGSRWLLATSGPRIGPAVLYWSELLALVLIAIVLGRVKLTPLGAPHWLLLGIGFSTFNWPVLGLIAGWLIIVGIRERLGATPGRLAYNVQQLGLGAITVISLLAIVASLPMGLLGRPDMHVRGFMSSGNSLGWLADASDSVLPVAQAWSAPMWAYKALILAWALWFSFALVRWLPWVWKVFARDGLWRSRTDEPARAAE